MRRWIKIAAGVFILLLVAAVLSALVFLRSPRLDAIAKNQIEAYLERRFAMRVEMGTVDVRPFHTEFELRDLRIFSLNTPDRPAIAWQQDGRG